VEVFCTFLKKEEKSDIQQSFGLNFETCEKTANFPSYQNKDND